MSRYSTYNVRLPDQSPRGEEAMAMRLLARALKEASNKAERNSALAANHRVWSSIFRDLNSTSCQIPPILRADLIRLARWSMAQSTRAVLGNMSLQPLAQINQDVADGLGEASPSIPAPLAIANQRVAVATMA